MSGSRSLGKVDRGAQGLNGHDCESVDTRSDCTTSVAVTAVD